MGILSSKIESWSLSPLLLLLNISVIVIIITGRERETEQNSCQHS
jgi:hypothetical protein